MACKRRSPKVVVNAARRNPNSDEIGFRLGMSMAVFFNQVRIGSVCFGGALFLVIGWLVFQSITEIMNDCCCVFVEILHLGFEVLVFVSGVCIEKLRF